MSAWELTRMAVAETAPPRVLAAYDCIPANRAGDPMIGLLGFMSPGDCLLLVRAADLAHRRLGTDGWEDTPDRARARQISRCGAWRDRSSTRRSEVVAAIAAYKSAIRADLDQQGVAS